jgi:hypothetical protein
MRTINSLQHPWAFVGYLERDYKKCSVELSTLKYLFMTWETPTYDKYNKTQFVARPDYSSIATFNGKKIPQHFDEYFELLALFQLVTYLFIYLFYDFPRNR